MKVSQILARSEPEPDADREGVRQLLGLAASVLPALPVDEFVAVACAMFSELKRFAPTMVADVARRMGVV